MHVSNTAFGHAINSNSVPEVVKDLICKLLVKAPERRLGATDIAELRQHPFFEGLDFDSLYCG